MTYETDEPLFHSQDPHAGKRRSVCVSPEMCLPRNVDVERPQPPVSRMQPYLESRSLKQ